MEDTDKRPQNTGIGTNEHYVSEMYETTEEFVIQLGLPEVDPDEIDIMLDERGVQVQAQQEQLAAESVENGIYRQDTLYAGFARYIPLPVCADIEEAEAFYVNNTLLIHVPKKDDKKRKRLKAKKK